MSQNLGLTSWEITHYSPDIMRDTPALPAEIDVFLKLSGTAEQRGTGPSIAEIQASAAVYFGVSSADLASPCRARRVARPRQVAMYLARRMTGRSFSEIGRLFRGGNHTTVMHACCAVEALIEVDLVFHAQVELLRLRIGNSGQQEAA